MTTEPKPNSENVANMASAAGVGDTANVMGSKRSNLAQDPTQASISAPIFKKKKLSFVIALVLCVLVGITIFLGFYLKNSLQRVKALETVVAKNSQQLEKLDQILGRTLNAGKVEEGVQSSFAIKLSIDAFKQLSDLLSLVEQLQFMPTEKGSVASVKPSLPSALDSPAVPNSQAGPISPAQRAPTAVKPAANAEIRWWSKFINQFMIPLQSYFVDLVHIQVMDEPISRLAMSPSSQQLFLKEVTLRLLTIRQLALNGLTQEALADAKVLRSEGVSNLDLQAEKVMTFMSKLDLLILNLEKIKESFQPAQNPLREN